VFTASISQAQFKVSDNFSRANGDVGAGWSAYGGGAQIVKNQVATFGVGGGISRKLDVTFPLKFSFFFTTASPASGGWEISFNAATAHAQNGVDDEEFGVDQSSGSSPVCVFYTNSGGAHCVAVVSGQRDYTKKALISGTVNADFSTVITIKYNDGLNPTTVTVNTPAPVGSPAPQGSLLLLGNISVDHGPHTFDTLTLSF
jgi:hypothetical protein